MAEKTNYIDLEEMIDARKGRRGDGGVYLVVADDSEEFNLALRYATRRARTNRAHVGILHVVEMNDFMHWAKVEKMMQQDMRDQAEKFIWSVAKKVNDLENILPVLYIREGDRKDAIIDVINEDMNIRGLVLGGSTRSSGPGPLISHFVGKGLGRLRVPLIVVPGHLDPQKVDTISG